MEKRTYVMGADCSKCHQFKPRVEKSAEMKGAELQVVLFDDYEDKENIFTVPTLIVDNGESKEHKTDESLVTYIQP